MHLYFGHVGIYFNIFGLILTLVFLFSRHIDLSLDGVEIIMNGSASHHELRKICDRVNLVKTATYKVFISDLCGFCVLSLLVYIEVELIHVVSMVTTSFLDERTNTFHGTLVSILIED